MDFTGSRKYSVPRLASAQGEDAARRAMPTSSVAGFVLRSGTGGGAEAPLGDSQLPWRAAGGNKVRLVCFASTGRRRSVASLDRSMGEVAIGSLAAPADYIRLLFAVSRIIFAFLSPVQRYKIHVWKSAWKRSSSPVRRPIYWFGPPLETQPCLK